MSHRMVFLLPMSSCMRAKLEIRPLSLANFQQKFPRNLMLCTTTLPPMGMHDAHRLFAIVLASGHWEPGLADTSSQTLWSISEEGIRYGKRDMPPEFPGSVKYLGPCWSLALTGRGFRWRLDYASPSHEQHVCVITAQPHAGSGLQRRLVTVA